MIKDNLLKEIEEYCKLNELDVSKTLNEVITQGFTILKYGVSPRTPKVIEKTVEVIKKVPVEKIIEVPVEKVVEVIKEVPIDRVIEKNINVNIDGKEINYVEYIDKLNSSISKLEISNSELKKELLNSNKIINDYKNQLQIFDNEINDLKNKLHNCENNNNFDIYGEK